MGKPTFRFVAKALPSRGWRVWDRKMKKWWGNLFDAHPSDVLAELNGEKRPAVITALTRRNRRIRP
jgi:hypothetical protein